MTARFVSNLQSAAALFGKGNLAEAETICRQLLDAAPEAVDVLHLLALIRRRQGDGREAEALLRSCLQLAPNRADVHANLGNLLSAQERLDEAQAEYRLALQLDGEFRAARLGLARALSRVGRKDEALREAERLTAADDRDTEAWTIAGSVLSDLGRVSAAEAALERAIALHPQNGVAQHNLGVLLLRESRNEDALLALRRAANAGIGGRDIDFNVASALMGLNRFDDAEKVLSAALQHSADDARAHRLLARLRFMRGAADYADDLFAAVRRFPANVVLRLTCSQTLRGAGRPEGALDVLRAAPGADPRLSAELAATLQQAGRFVEAEQAARAAVAADPGNAAFVDVLLDPLLSLGRADEAMPLIEAARRRQPANQWYIAMEATAARLLGDARYGAYFDYDNLVQCFELEPPRGWSSLAGFHADLIPVLKERHRFRAQPLDQSLRHGTQTPRGLLGDPDPLIRILIAALSAAVEHYRARVGFDPAHVFRARNQGATRLVGCWSVQLGAGGFHVNHVHSEGWISSAYYVEVPPETADADRKPGWLKLGEPRFPVPGATAERFLRPFPGRLVLFPSYMWHGTTPIGGREPRLSVAFDALADGA